MGLFGRVKKAAKRIGRKFGGVATGGMWNPQAVADAKKDEGDTRSEAAAQLLKKNVNVQRQAGSGQIKYTGEEEVLE